MLKKEFLKSDYPLAFAHRGGALEAPENSMSAFKTAISMGFKYLETDVHATKDGSLIAFHDHILDRVTDGTGAIADLTYSEVSKAKIGGKERIPLLVELLEEFPQAKFNIDPKHDAAVEPLIKVIKETKSIHRVCVASFSDSRIHHISQSLGEDLCTGMGPTGISKIQLGRFIGKHRLPVGDCVQVPMKIKGIPLITPKFVQRVHRLGKVIHAWTINDPENISQLLDYGVDGIMTDKPETLKEIYQQRGIWK
ncbi:MAG: glycerophosphodiester phosphodiesterase [Acidimicrobiales bacterium]|jgi:glycerophosphoryl diester phosphodiesterase|nr:glycerophosphodiester phosphodiesterase [Acidimicrobiales bacterium]MDP6298715.1 glycerophosphodiester phosphodiesterase [Acidimicrobiales bacterium]HJM27852.1 glycerophosphodiester phosphodiesterase [Acidimicrobiales bacterium]